jgi:hypothetical protein
MLINSFSIQLYNRDNAILYKIQKFFGMGQVGKVKTRDHSYFIVRKKSELELIVKHFNNYPLLSKKRIDFYLFNQCFILISKGINTNRELIDIVSYK